MTKVRIRTSHLPQTHNRIHGFTSMKKRPKPSARKLQFIQSKVAKLCERAQANSSKEILSEGKTPEKLFEAAENAESWLDHLHESARERERPLIACQKGCNYCCHQEVHATIPEILLIAGTLHERCSPEELKAVKERCRHYIAGSKGLTILQNLQPCPLLVDGLCSIYENRPLTCRGYFSESVEPCRRGLEHPEDTTNFVKAWGLDITYAVIEGVKEAIQSHRLDGRRFRLLHALLIILEQPGVIDRFLRGEKVFREAL